MNLVAISGSGWSDSPAAGHSLLARIALAAGDDTILLDRETLRREAKMLSQKDAEQASGVCIDQSIVSFGQWMKDARLAEDIINPVAIQETARVTPCGHVIVIDARHYRLELIVMALEQARVAWYPLDEWHPTFAVICDDAILLRTLQMLAPTFYSQPQVLTARETRIIVRSVMHRAFIYRWFGARAGRIMRWLAKFAKYAKATRERISFLVGERRFER